MNIESVTAYTAPWAATIGVFWLLFSKAEDVISPEKKEEVARWLKNLNPEKAVSNWPATFATVFDQIFGERHLSWKCFLRSCVASLISLIVVALVINARYPNFFYETILEIKPTYNWEMFDFIYMAVFINFIPDYISLLETRWVIHKMGKNNIIIRKIIFLTFDLFLTTIISLGGYLLAAVLSPIFFTESTGSADIYLDEAIWVLGSMAFELLTFDTDKRFYFFGIYFYSAFFTSVWAWFYAASSIIIRPAKYFGVITNRLKGILDIDHQPLRSIGYVSIILITFLYLVAYII